VLSPKRFTSSAVVSHFISLPMVFLHLFNGIPPCVPTLLWCWGLCTPMTRRAMSAVA
jgi:hypothetical protein